MVFGAGAVFAGYRIRDVLGRGGMGTVYLAQHPRLPREVALKVLNREVSTDPELVRRFEREADVVARLDHPGVVGVLDRGAEDGHLWIAMHYIQGADAATWDASAHPPATTVRLLAEVGVALDYAHSRGILHRDVKPANILITASDAFRDQQAVITDFGIAAVLDATDTKITATGTFTATLAYASPEQLSGEAVDHRSDQYSLACTLYAMLAGQPPYVSASPGQVVAGHLTKPVPRLAALRPDLPAALDEILARAMAKQRQDRFGTCIEFMAAVRAALESADAVVTVNSARTTPTVRNSAAADDTAQTEPEPKVHPQHPRPAAIPADQIPNASAATSSGKRAPIAPRPGRRRRFGFGAFMVIVFLIGAVSVYLSDPLDFSTPPWGEYQSIRDDFPSLLSEEYGSGWREASCTAGKGSQGLEITCYDRENSGISFFIRDYSTSNAVEERLSSSDFRHQEFVAGPDIVHSSETRSAPHSGLATAAKMIVPPGASVARIYATAYFSFPGDSVRGRYLIGVSWWPHTADDILRDWWSQAPLDR